jgi:ammonia channel protein AmtB
MKTHIRKIATTAICLMALFLFAARAIGTSANIVFIFALSYAFFKVLDLAMGLRVDREMELEGLDQHEVAVTAYPDFNIRNLPYRTPAGHSPTAEQAVAVGQPVTVKEM